MTSRYFDVSSVYHEVKAQSVLKLYVIINTLEIFDKLFSALSQVRSEATARGTKGRGDPAVRRGGTATLIARRRVYFFLLPASAAGHHFQPGAPH